MIEILNEYGRTWAGYFGPAVVQNTLFLGLVFVVLHWLRNASARVKYAVAAVGLVKLLLPPFVPWQLIVPAAAPSFELPTSTLFFSFTNPPLGTTPPAAAPSIGLDIFGALFWIWAGAVLIILARSIIMTVYLANAVKNAVAIDDDPAAEAALERGVGVFKSDRIGMPLTVGVFPRRIFVPTAWDSWSLPCRRAVVRHELAHISRRDGLFQVLEIVVQALYFFHPMVLILNQRLREYREMACDDASVGRERNSRLDYSKFLLDLAETAIRPPVACDSASALIRRKNELFKRVAYQVKEDNMLRMSKTKMAVVLAVMIVSVVPLSLQLGNAYHPDRAVAGKKQSASRQASFDIALKGDAIYCCGDEVDMKGLEQMLAKIADEKGDDAVFHIDCKGDVPMASLFKVQKQMMDHGLYKVSYADGEVDLPLVLPNEKIKEKMKSIPENDICFVKIEESGKVLINKKKVGEANLQKAVEKCLDDNPKLVVSIYMDDKTRYDDFVTVLGKVKKAGAERVLVNQPTT